MNNIYILNKNNNKSEHIILFFIKFFKNYFKIKILFFLDSYIIYFYYFII